MRVSSTKMVFLAYFWRKYSKWCKMGCGEKEEQLNQTKTNPLKILGTRCGIPPRTKELTNTALYN